MPKTKLAVTNIFDGQGRTATILTQYDQALRETKQFWEEQAPDHRPEWDYILGDSAAQSPFPVAPPPSREVFKHAVANSKDSAPGPDGIPYAYYRTLSTETADILQEGLLDDCLTGLLPPALQALVLIPKTDLGCNAGNYRLLDMPNGIDRLLDLAVCAVAAEALGQSLRSAKSLVNSAREPPGNYATMQDMLDDNNQLQVVMLTWLKHSNGSILDGFSTSCKREPPQCGSTVLLLTLCGRRTTHRAQGHLLSSITLRQGLAMGRATFALLFCLAMDPLAVAFDKVPESSPWTTTAQPAQA